MGPGDAGADLPECHEGRHLCPGRLGGTLDPGGDRAFTGLICERVHYAAGQGLCLVPENGFVSTFYAYIFGKDSVPRTRIELAGPVTRARVSPDGR